METQPLEIKPFGIVTTFLGFQVWGSELKGLELERESSGFEDLWLWEESLTNGKQDSSKELLQGPTC